MLDRQLGRESGPSASIDAQRAGAVGHQQQKASGDRDVLQEHDHLHLVAEVVVEDERAQQGEAAKQEGDNAGLPSEDYGKSAARRTRPVISAIVSTVALRFLTEA